MKNKTIITVSTDVDIDVTDYVEDILEYASDEQLTKELESRGKCNISKGNNVVIDKSSIWENENLKRSLCDVFDVQYTVSNERLLDLISDAL